MYSARGSQVSRESSISRWGSRGATLRDLSALAQPIVASSAAARASDWISVPVHGRPRGRFCQDLHFGGGGRGVPTPRRLQSLLSTRLHGGSNHAPHSRVSGCHVRSVDWAEADGQRFEERAADHIVVGGDDSVGRMLGTELLEDGHERFEISQHADGDGNRASDLGAVLLHIRVDHHRVRAGVKAGPAAKGEHCAYIGLLEDVLEEQAANCGGGQGLHLCPCLLDEGDLRRRQGHLS
mmetsp:Transcript_71099/g.140936  ORF Transcript_71099/g.140936 Transcript_71099/m.140936 type:complete len:238 (-) Transcript_71099:91-804(-)